MSLNPLHFIRMTTTILMSSIIACSTCRVSMIEGGGDAGGWSIFFLLAIILAVLIGVVFCMIRIARREKENFDPQLSDDYHHPATSN
jgi:heme/copper-type cytochrome/quinol oxidase subunit 2